MTGAQDAHGPFLRPGTPVVRYAGPGKQDPEYGVVVHCWLDDEIGGYDCYIAFFGDRPPTGKLVDRPYILRYASTSLIVLKEMPPD